MSKAPMCPLITKPHSAEEPVVPVGCYGPGCAMWIEQASMCSFKKIGMMVTVMNITPADMVNSMLKGAKGGPPETPPPPDIYPGR